MGVHTIGTDESWIERIGIAPHTTTTPLSTLTEKKQMTPLTDEERVLDLVSKASKIDRRSYNYLESNYESIQNAHGGEIVAVVNRSVVDSIDSDAEKEEIRTFIERVRSDYGDEAYISQIPEPDQSLLL